MPNVIKNLKITEVALCPEGMNPEAKITLFKSKTDPVNPLKGGDPEHNKGGDVDSDKPTLFEKIRRIFKGDLNEELERKEASRRFWDVIDAFYDSISTILYSDQDEDQKAAELSRTADQLAAHMKDLAPKMVQKSKGGNEMDLEKVLEGLDETARDVIQARISELEAEVEKAKNPETDPVVKQLPEELQKQWDQMQADLKKAKDRNHRADIEKRVSAYSMVADVDEMVDVIKFVEDHQPVQKDDTPSMADRIEGILKSAQERIQAGGLYAEFGSNHDDSPSAFSEIQKKVEELRKERTDLTEAQAMDYVIQNEPALYERYLNERSRI